MTILAIDPGCSESAYVVWDGVTILRKQKLDNALLVDGLQGHLLDADEMAIEQIASYGMAVGAEVFETVFWSGRFAQVFAGRLKPVWRIKRLEVKIHLCHDSKAKDANIRQALIDRFGGPLSVKGYQKASPKKGRPERPQGALYGVVADEWAALAVACTFWDKHHPLEGE